MNDDGDGTGKGLSGPNEEEVLVTWARVITDLKASRVCFYPGPGGGRRPDFRDFTWALQFIGDCDALVFAEPRRTKLEVWKLVDAHRLNLAVPIPGIGFITGLEMVDTGNLPGVDRRGLFRVAPLEWLPPARQPKPERFWGEYAKLTIDQNQDERQVHLLHLGIGGIAAMVYFVQPHRIELGRVISAPPQ